MRFEPNLFYIFHSVYLRIKKKRKKKEKKLYLAHKRRFAPLLSLACFIRSSSLFIDSEKPRFVDIVYFVSFSGTSCTLLCLTSCNMG